jgi:glycine cleavage system H protein
MNVPEDLRYQKSHEWVRLEGDVATIGITDHAQEELTDVVFVELPELGRTVDAGDATAVVESVKAASDIYSPVSGEVVEANEAVEADPSLVNSDPYGEGWIYKLKLSDPSQVEAMMDASAYQQMIG